MDTLLIDTHILIWLMYSPSRIPQSVKLSMSSADKVFVSVVSFWEISIKHKSGKLKYNARDILENLQSSGVELMNIDEQSVLAYEDVVLPQSDPFDSMLMAHVLSGNMRLVTADKLIIQAYPDKVIDAASSQTKEPKKR